MQQSQLSFGASKFATSLGGNCARNFAAAPSEPEPRYLVTMSRNTYIVAYDVACPRRLARTLGAVKAWRAAGQKSVAECFMSAAERNGLCRELADIIEADEDRLHVIRLDPRIRPELFGVARHHGAQPFVVI